MTVVTVQRKKGSYLREVQSELKKVSWTPREELFSSTRAVVVATFVFGFGIYICDLVIRGVIDGLGSLVRVVFG